MLEPQSRRLFMEALQPPAGHRLDWAVGTTYSMDLLTLLSAPLAFAFSDCQDRDGRPVENPLVLLKAVRQYADRICLFCEAGRIHVPRNYLPFLASLESSIVAAIAPLGGSFHPKVWFLRYVAEDESVIYRLLCSSRNLTFDRCWDTMLCLEGALRERKNAFARNHTLGEFVESLSSMSPGGLAPIWKKRLGQLADDVRRVDFEIPEPFEELAFWPLGISDAPIWPFPKRLDRVLVVSPFVDDKFLGKMSSHEVPVDLVSRPETLARLQRETLLSVESVWMLDDTAEPESVDADDAVSGENTNEPGTASKGAGVSALSGLHAKLFVADVGWNAHVWTGSANATTAAFERNVEFLVELRGKRSQCGAAATLGDEEQTRSNEPNCLRDMLVKFIPSDDAVEADHDEEAFDRHLSTVARNLVAAVPEADCQLTETADVFRVELRPTRTGGPVLPSGYRLTVRPISFSEGTERGVDVGQECWVTFESVSMLGLTSFFVFELTSPDQRFRKPFVLNIPLLNPPAQRHESILRSVLSDREHVRRFLLLLMSDAGARDFARWLQDSNDDSETTPTAFAGLAESTLLESLLRALDRDPEQLDQVAQVIHDLRESPTGSDLLPADLDAIWQPIWAVRQKQLAAREAARQRTKH